MGRAGGSANDLENSTGGSDGIVNRSDTPASLSLSVGKFIGIAELIALYAHDLTPYERAELGRALRDLDQALAGAPARPERRNLPDRRRTA